MTFKSSIWFAFWKSYTAANELTAPSSCYWVLIKMHMNTYVKVIDLLKYTFEYIFLAFKTNSVSVSVVSFGLTILCCEPIAHFSIESIIFVKSLERSNSTYLQINYLNILSISSCLHVVSSQLLRLHCSCT
jgi:hypothetical protein